MKKNNAVWFIIFGGLLGAFLTSWLAPKAIAWYFDPPVDIGVNCRKATEWSMAKLQLAQSIGLGIGAVLGLGTWMSTRRRRNPSPDENLPTEPQI